MAPYPEIGIMLLIHAKQINDQAILQCQGAIASGDETKLLCAAIRHESRDLILDLTHVDSINVAGIGALVSLQAAGTYLKLLNPTEAVRRVLKVTQLDTIFEICDERENDREERQRAIDASLSISPALAASGA
jgi:anti-anti-sigma factor